MTAHSTGSALLALLAAMCAVAASPAAGAGRVPAYRVVHGWPQLPPGDNVGQATGVAVDSHNRVYVFHRAGREWAGAWPTEPIARDTVWVFDGPSGRFLTSWGAGRFVIPHGLTIDRHDNVWLTDTGLHQVFKCTTDGRELMAIGAARIPGCDAAHFNQPTGVAVAADGSFYVSDGYGNARVAKFGADGAFQFAWGERGAGPGQFNLPHAVEIDAGGRVYVSDRGNSRVQVFDAHGAFVEQWGRERIGRPYAVRIARDMVFVVDGGDRPAAPPDRSEVVIADHRGAAIARFGRHGNYDGQFRNAHDLAVGPDGAVYVVDILGQRVQKFVRR